MNYDEIWHGDIAGSIRLTRSATNADATGPVGNAVTDIVENRVISTTGSGADWYYILNGSAANSIKGVFLANINTDTWATIQIQGDNADFAGAPAATQNLTVVTRYPSQYEWSPTQGEVVPANRHDAYVKIDWGYEDYRIKLNSTAVSKYEIGRIYIFKNILEVTHPSKEDMNADVVTKATEIEGPGGQYIRIPESQQMVIPLNIQRSPNKAEINELKYQVEQNPSCVYVCDGLQNGQILFGSFKFGNRQVYGKVFGSDKINLTGEFKESK